MLTMTLLGKPISKKNSQKIWYNKALGRLMIVPSDQFKRYEKECLRQIPPTQKLKLEGNLRLCARYWMPDRRVVDLLNLLAATSDLLEKAGVVVNDKDFINFDGSRIVGVDKERPRVEILITREG
jgi:Holliday junction resolvase RusA-like endonuclease